MKASIIIPTYKPKEYIYECLASVYRQTLSADDYEVIIILNGCNEPYKQDISKYIEGIASPSHNTHIIQTDIPGVSNARNMGLDTAKGDYIFFIDDDDYVSPTYLEGALSKAQDDSIVVMKFHLFDEETKEELHTNLTNAYDVAKEAIKHKPLNLYTGRRFLSAMCGKAIPRNIIGTKRFNKNFSLGEDSLFVTQLTNRIKNIYLAPEDAAYYIRKRSDSASRKNISNKDQFMNAVSLAFEYTKMYLSDIRHNNFKFYMSRIVASLLKIFGKKFRTV